MVRKTKGAGPTAKPTATTALSGVTASDLDALFMSMARLATHPGDDARDQAQEKAFEAMEARTAQRRIALAQEALAISPSCADAYGVLARKRRMPTRRSFCTGKPWPQGRTRSARPPSRTM